MDFQNLTDYRSQRVTSERVFSHTSERQTPDTTLDPRRQSGPSARNYPSLLTEDFQRIMGQTTKDCTFRIFIFDKFPKRATFAC